MREGQSLLSWTALLVVLGTSVVAHSIKDNLNAPGSLKKSSRMFETLADSTSTEDNPAMITERARRILETSYPTIDVKNHRKDQTLVFKNTFKFTESTDLLSQFSLKSDSNGMADSPSRSLQKPKAAFWGNSKDYIVLQMADTTQIDNEYLYLTVGTTSPTVYRSQQTIYQYYDSGAGGMMGVSVALAIVFMIFSCCCWCGGMRQFYLLIRIPQMLFMLTFLGSTPQASNYYSLLENLRYNLFSVVPNPVMIDEKNGNECQLPIQFFAEMLSCHVYNTLRYYVLGFIIFIILYGFIALNKYHDRPFFQRLAKTMDLHMFMLAIFPDVAIAIYLNAVAGLTNSVLSIGFFLCVLLIIWYVHIFNTIISDYYHDRKKEVVAFLRFFVFSRSKLTEDEPKLGIKLFAVLFEYLKIFIVVTMIALFYNAPRTQMVIVFLIYLLSALFMFVVRPYSNIFQNIFQGVSDLAFFIIVVLAFAREDRFDSTSMHAKEMNYGDAQSAMVFIIFFVNHFNFLIPMLKGQDVQTIIHKTDEAEQTVNESQGKSTTIMKKDPEAAQPHHVDVKDPAPKDYLGRPKIPERDIHTSDARSNSRITEGSELPGNKEEQVPMKPNSSENPALQTGKKKIEIKGMHPGTQKELKPSEENLLRNNEAHHDNIPPTSENRDIPATAHQSHQPKKNNLLVSMPVEPTKTVPQSQAQSMVRLDQSPAHESNPNPAKSSELPPVRTGKIPVRKTFKPAEVKNQDFEGM